MSLSDAADARPVLHEQGDQSAIVEFARYDVDEALRRLGSSRRGLTSEQAASRLQRAGPNALRTHKANPWAVLGRQLRSPILILLVVTAGISVFLGDVTNSIVIGVILLASVGASQSARQAPCLHRRPRRYGRAPRRQDRHVDPGQQQLRPELIQLIWDRTIAPGVVFDLTLPLEDAAEGYKAMDERRATKVLLTV